MLNEMEALWRSKPPTPKAMTGEVIIDDPNNLNEATRAFVEEGFSVELLHDWIDDGGSNVIWLLVDLVTELSPDEFFDEVAGIVAPFGEVIEAGPCTPEQRRAWRIKDLDK